MKKKMTSMALAAVGTAVASPALAQVNTQINVNNYGSNDPEAIVINLINWALGILAIIAVVLVLVGGFKWMTAAGSDDKVGEAKKVLTAAITGLLIVLAAWGISLYAVTVLADVTGANTF